MTPTKNGAGAEGSKRSLRKRQAILDAATEVFLRDGYLGTSMDEIAALSEVSKQTVYKHFTSKEALFVEIVSSLTDRTGDAVHDEMPPLQEAGDVAAYLEAYGHRQLSIVLTPRIMQLRRLVIGEVSRFPELARVLYERGPQRAMDELAELFGQLSADGLLDVKDPAMAAVHFNWLVMAQALNQAMLLGDEAIPKPAEQRRAVKEGLGVFLAAYGVK
ncbi:TetR/AcrR family transcriptional regulator [Mesorhizobium sp. Z1-4]|uniref:TetR/AcrR family transcriptional regulator n=1 Tax=Mesorhizobium sp. Z1-4 TaxID=2448478 RepID=UPI000FD728F4|nr:TetR/AcrR family transcriptional regulator [Mesorhizobium sp. Z1-4]